MAFLLAIEGADGAGKATVSAEVARLLQVGRRRAEVVSFPRYADTAGGHVLGDYLAGRLPRAVTPKAAAVLYALDRLESRAHLDAVAAANDVIVFDRYIASNMAYQAAQVPADEARALMDWIAELETGQFALPAPDLSVYLDTPAEVARALILKKRRRSYTDDAFDAYEADIGLQARVRENYAAMAAGGTLGRWATVSTTVAGVSRPPETIAADVVALLAQVRPG
ncbi:thymidylate kinase [Sphingomonas sp.]|jgi:dTMP kinase|uniref:thymidylate kinase n=1 Tax=Sphingomonas sp. TaxID=28214 RepID=UPI002EDB2F32